MEMIKNEEQAFKLVIDFCGKHLTLVDLTGYKAFIGRVHEKSNFKGDPEQSYFAYLINVILINNLAEMMLEQAKQMECRQIKLSAFGAITEKGKMELMGVLDTEGILRGVAQRILHSEQSLSGDLTLDLVDELPGSPLDPAIAVPEIFNFQPQGVTDFKQRLNEDLIAFQFVKKNQKNELGRFILPVYVDEARLAEQGFADVEQYLPAWASMHYLEMLTKIHDFFIQYYQSPGPKGFHNDDLMVALVDLLDYQISPYPSGLQKSLEVGRSTSGKCAFILGPVESFAIPQEIMIGLQAKDIFGIVPRISPLT